MKLRRCAAAVMALLMGCGFSCAALANSAPIYGAEKPGSQVLPMTENGVGVEKELLTFHMRGDGSADVSADYTLKSLTGEKKTVKMAFPYLLRLSDIQDIDEVSIRQDGEPLEYEFQLAGTVISEDGGSQQDFLKDSAPFVEAVKLENILAGLEAEKYRPEYYNRTKSLKTYVLEYPDDGKEYKIVVKMTLHEDDRILLWGFNGFDITDKTHAEFSTWVGPGHGGTQEYGFAVLAGDGPEEITAETYYEKKLVQTNAVSVRKGSGCSAEELIEKYTSYPGSGGDGINESVKAACIEFALKEIDRQLSWGQAAICTEDLTGGMYSECYVGVLLYEVELPADGAVQMTVSYRQRATWDAASDDGTVYTYAYLTSPAAYFESFGKFSVKVEPADEQLYITNSNLPFAAQEDGSYLAYRDGLPENELVFSMYKEETAPAAGAAGGGNDGMRGLTDAGLIAAAVVLATLIGVLAVKTGRKKPTKAETGNNPAEKNEGK